MGRKSTSLKSKSSAVVEFPHDGPIYNFFTARQGETNSDDEIQVALKLLAPHDNISPSDEFWELTHTLCQTLQSSDSIKTQLHALQSYRSTLLNWKQQKSQDDSLRIPRNDTAARGLYRLLLEWSLSNHTPLPLQRAVQSNLNTLDFIDKGLVATSVLKSVWSDDSNWNDRLHSLDVAVNFPYTSNILQTTCLDDCILFLSSVWLSRKPKDDELATGLRIVKLLKIVLQDQDVNRSIPLCSELKQKVISLMKIPSMPSDGFNTLGIVYAKLHLCNDTPTKNAMDSRQLVANSAILLVLELQAENKLDMADQISLLARLSIVQGIAAMLDPDTLLCSVSIPNNSLKTPLEVCWTYSLQASQISTDPIARWAAIKGLSTLASRWQQQQQQNEATNVCGTHVYDTLIQATLDTILQAWENPPLRKLGSAIPGIFETLVQLLPRTKLQDLCRTVVNQPLNRKGRYLALEILLPYFPTTQDISILSVDSLLEGVGDRGPNTGPIADLWIKLLGHMWNENGKRVEPIAPLEHWILQWVPSLSRALLTGDLSRRKQVANFCLVRLLEYLRRTESLQDSISECIELLLNHVASTNLSELLSLLSPNVDENHSDRILWAHLELARLFYVQRLITPRIQQAVSFHIPVHRLHRALTHEQSFLRLVAFQSLEAVIIGAYGQGILNEAETWKTVLPCSIKVTDSKEYTANILQCLTNFLDRYCAWEVNHSVETIIPLPSFYSFTVDFILGELVLKRGAYPGTVADKEEFSLLLLESILTFALQDQSYSRENGVARKGGVFVRKRQDSEQISITAILKSLLQQEIFASIFCLLHSSWDNTRLIAFRVLSKFVLAAHTNGLSLPSAYSDDEALRHLKSRGLFLASSPRQREADTGSRLLAFMCIARKSGTEHLEFMSELVGFLEVRLTAMKKCLESLLHGNMPEGSALDSGKQLPLAHGIINSIMLTIQHQSLLANTKYGLSSADVNLSRLYERLLDIFCEGMRIALKVVADVRDGETIDGLEENHVENNKSAATPLNVNTGAIGANGTFSKLSRPGVGEQEARLAMQRVVVGTWLLTKETCGAMAAIMASQGFQPAPPLVEKCGALLISTLTSLKHAGAAFAARDSLQEIAFMCLRSDNDKLRIIPEVWVTRLLGEMCSAEKVRDSTLRRSTGYALGFLALMRSELSTRSGRSVLCDRILKCLVAYSLPAAQDLKNALCALNFVHDDDLGFASVFSFCADGGIVLPDSEYESRCRVHALNVLRMIILDAPLASAVRPYIGDSIISSLLGYSDPTWAVRNSATMVFSAAMLRVVDADKNASNRDRTSSQAITLTELFRRYPPLSIFLPAMLQHCLNNQDKPDHSQLFPILLLLSRTQPVAHSGGSSETQVYPDLIFKALRNKHHAIRAAAARSLANVCSDECSSLLSSNSTLKRCATLLLKNDGVFPTHWNHIDGVLLAMKSFLSTGDKQENVLDDLGVKHLFEQIIRFELDSPYPVSCVSTVLDIMVHLTQDAIQRKALLPQCMAIVKNSSFEDLVGGTFLYGSAANSIINLIETNLWKPCDVIIFQESLSCLQALFTAELIDVRLTAVKTFKKRIYQNIDDILVERHKTVPADHVLSKIATVLLNCMAIELKRGRTSQHCLGSHIPTIRRLSRCFMECFDGHQRSKTASIRTFIQSVQSSENQLWAAAMSILEHEKFLGDEASLASGEVFLSGNGVELMAIQIASDFASGEMDDNRVQFFIKAIHRLNNPHVSWRSRFSAVKSIEISRILAESKHPGYREAILSEIMEMLQDSDADVRSCATRTAQQVPWLQLDGCGQSWSGLPIPTLCRLHAMTYRADSNEETRAQSIVDSLLKSALGNSQDLIPTLTSLDEDLEQTRMNEELSHLTNAADSRRIFEEETPNPFNERILRDQLAVQALLQLPSCERWKTPSETVTTMLHTITPVMTLLQTRLNSGGIIHDLTRYPTVFPALHGVLGLVGASIYLGIIPEKNKIELQSKSVRFLEDAPSFVHPEILALIECLSHAETGSEATKKSLLKCLFLL